MRDEAIRYGAIIITAMVYKILHTIVSEPRASNCLGVKDPNLTVPHAIAGGASEFKSQGVATIK